MMLEASLHLDQSAHAIPARRNALFSIFKDRSLTVLLTPNATMERLTLLAKFPQGNGWLLCLHTAIHIP